MPRTLSSETLRKLELLRENTEGNLPPYIQQIPATFIVDGAEKCFTLSALEEIWDRMERLWAPDQFRQNTVWIHKKNSADLSMALKRTRDNTLGIYLAESVTEDALF